MEDHIVGRKRKVIKLTFDNENGLQRARKDIMIDMKRATKPDTFSFDEVWQWIGKGIRWTIGNIRGHTIGNTSTGEYVGLDIMHHIT